MRSRLGLHVCPEADCPVIGISGGGACPRHEKPLVREIYVRQVLPPRITDEEARQRVRDMIGKIPRGILRKAVERKARELGCL